MRAVFFISAALLSILMHMPSTYRALPTIQHAASLLRIPEELSMWADRVVSTLLQQAKATAFNGVIIMGHEDFLTFTTKKHPTVWKCFNTVVTSSYVHARSGPSFSVPCKRASTPPCPVTWAWRSSWTLTSQVCIRMSE